MKAIVNISEVNIDSVVGNKVHLCESCTQDVPTCHAKFGDLLFGDGFGSDNVCCCPYYEPIKRKEKDTEK